MTEGNNYFEVIGASNIVDKNKAVNDALNAGALRHRDMWQVPTGLEEFSAGVSVGSRLLQLIKLEMSSQQHQR